MRKIAEISIENEEFELLPERCLFRKKTRTLLAADLHWGKAEVFQKHGIALPSNVLDDDLARLDQAIAETNPETLLILGDLIHAPMGVTPSVIERVARWRDSHPEMKFQLIRGNHDRQHRWPIEWKLEDLGTQLTDGDFLFTHDEPVRPVEQFVWAGHFHPAVKLGNGSDSLKLPCFTIQLNGKRGLLPAFSAFTGGANIAPRTRSERVFAITETAVIEV